MIIVIIIYSLVPVIEKYETGLLMLCGFAGFSAMIGFLYNQLRSVWKDLIKFIIWKNDP